VNKPSVAAFLVAAATIVQVAPAEAAAAKDWIRVEIPCRTGHQVAVIGYSPTHPWWGPSDDDGAAGLNPKRWASWYKNPCQGQWLLTGRWTGDPSPSSNVYYNIGTGQSGRIGGLEYGRLSDTPICEVGGADLDWIAKTKQLDDGDRYCSTVE
jgi:hypothetical protein